MQYLPIRKCFGAVTYEEGLWMTGFDKFELSLGMRFMIAMAI